jgi:hypothetical protein
LHFFALSVATSLKIPGAVIPRRVFTRPGPNADLRPGATARRRVEVGSTPVIQISKLGSFQSCGYDLTDHEWAAIKPMLPNKPRGVARVNDRRVLNGTRVGLGAERALATELPTMSRSRAFPSEADGLAVGTFFGNSRRRRA